MVIEGIFGALFLLCPEQGFMCIRESHPAEVRRGIRLDPDDVVEDPITEVLQDRAHPKDIVIRTDHPDRAGILKHTAAGGQPGAGEDIVLFEAVELIPGLHHAVLRASYSDERDPAKAAGYTADPQRSGRWTLSGRRFKHLEAIALNDLIQGQTARYSPCQGFAAYSFLSVEKILSRRVIKSNAMTTYRINVLMLGIQRAQPVAQPADQSIQSLV